MMSRGIASPIASRRWPLSIGCEISSLTSNASPRFTRFGTLISTRTIGPSIDARGERDQKIDPVAPATAVGELRHRGHGLRRGEPDARGDSRRAGARAEPYAQDMRQRIAFREHVDAAHVANRRVDTHRHADRIAVL